MASPDDRLDLERTTAFRWAMQDRMATGIEPFGWGTALLNARFPLSYGVNLLRVERFDDHLTPERLVEEGVRQILGRSRALGSATHLRHFAAFADGAGVSIADLYSDGHTAQIEDVWTREDQRGRGLARAVVLAAAGVAVAEAHDLTFILAD